MPPRGRIAARMKLRAAQNDTRPCEGRRATRHWTRTGPPLPAGPACRRGAGVGAFSGGPFSGGSPCAPAQTPREAREASSSLTSRWPETRRVPRRPNLPPQIQGHGPETTLAPSLNLGVGGARGARPTHIRGRSWTATVRPGRLPAAAVPGEAVTGRARRRGADAALLQDAWGGS